MFGLIAPVISAIYFTVGYQTLPYSITGIFRPCVLFQPTSMFFKAKSLPLNGTFGNPIADVVSFTATSSHEEARKRTVYCVSYQNVHGKTVRIGNATRFKLTIKDSEASKHTVDDGSLALFLSGKFQQNAAEFVFHVQFFSEC
jgi:hypothetical protein